MKNAFKTFLVLILCLTIISSMTVQASSDTSQSQIHKILNQWESAINSKNLEKYLNVFDDEMRNDIELAINSAKTDDEKKYLEFYSIDNLSVKSIQKLSVSDLENVYPIYLKDDVEYEIYYLYFESKINGNLKNKYSLDGKNFRLCLINKYNDEWKISQFSAAPVAALVNKGISLGSLEEEKIKVDIETKKEKIKEFKAKNPSLDLMNLDSASVSSLVTTQSVSRP